MALTIASFHRHARTLLTAMAAVVCFGHAPTALADETEVFRSDNENGNARPKVLIIFDNSGSMDTLAQRKQDYNPNTVYPTIPGIEAGRIYWAPSTNNSPPPVNTANWFPASINRCAESTTALNTSGRYTSGGRIGAFFQNATAWVTITPDAKTALHVECRADVTERNAGNPGLIDGFPYDNSDGNYDGYRSTRARNMLDNFTSASFYTANYMNYWYGDFRVDRSRMDVAQKVVTNIVNSNPNIDFGLATFNQNSTGLTDGGRIIRRIVENMSASERQTVVNLVNGLDPSGFTPLCESMYEAYRYLSGGQVLFGYEKGSGDGPARDTAAERSGGRYISPAGDCQYVYVILMTDGEPTLDDAADTLVRTLTGKTSCPVYGNTRSCLPLLTEYMYNSDLDGVSTNGIQRAVTYTIGFATDQALLRDTATKGGGQYYTADSTEELTSAFQGAITSILSTNAAFTSPAVAVDSFTRTESRDDVFYAMFRPTTGVNWPGNIKKLRVKISNTGTASIVDSTGGAALDPQTGFIKETAITFWGTTADGPAVAQGGAGGLLAVRNPDTRNIKTNTGKDNNGKELLQNFAVSSFTADAYSVGDQNAVHALFDVASATEFSNLIAWARGWTDAGKSARRDWVLGDIVHSRPLVLNYGARTGDYSKTNPDLRVVVGTNAGFLHMFNAANGAEDWAFFPKELTRLFKRRKDDQVGGNKVWGVDAPVVSYRFDINQDGSIKAADGDKMYIFFGLRRGGRAMYAMDVTDPNNPVFLWQINNSKDGFSELGQTWSVPVVTNIPGYTENGVRKPVLIFGAGYDDVNDDITLTAAETPDTMGRGLFIVDAVSGDLVWSVTRAATTRTNKQELGFVHAMAAPPAVIDSNGDGVADRIYMPDVGGNVWRVDMPGNNRPTEIDQQNRWRVTKLASLATVATTNPARQAGDRRFLSEVDVVRTSFKGRAFDAVLLGSGDRTNPKAVDNNDRFFMLRDFQVTPYTTDAPTAGQCTASPNPSTDNRCRLPITESKLYNASANLIQVGTADQRNAALNSLSTAVSNSTSMGWYLNLTSSLGEKSLSASTTLRGITFFTTFAPNSATSTTTNTNICEPAAGTARLYAVNLQDASATIDFNNNGALVTADRSVLLGSTVPDTPSLYFSRDQQIRLLFPAGGGPVGGGSGEPDDSGSGGNGDGCKDGTGILCGPRGLRPVVPTYRYEQEY